MLNFHVLATELRQLVAAIEVERFSGIVTSIKLTASFDAQAGLVKNLPFVEYTYSHEVQNKTIFEHLYVQNALR